MKTPIKLLAAKQYGGGFYFSSYECNFVKIERLKEDYCDSEFDDTSYDLILGTKKDGRTLLFLGEWNDGVVEDQSVEVIDLTNPKSNFQGWLIKQINEFKKEYKEKYKEIKFDNLKLNDYLSVKGSFRHDEADYYLVDIEKIYIDNKNIKEFFKALGFADLSKFYNTFNHEIVTLVTKSNHLKTENKKLQDFIDKVEKFSSENFGDVYYIYDNFNFWT